MRVKDLMSSRVITIEAKDTLSLASQTMLWFSIRHLPVLEAGKVVGMLSERDVLRARAAGTPLQAQVRAAMSTPPHFAHPEDAVVEVSARMASQKLGALPVIDKGALLGVLSTTDLLAAEVADFFVPRRELPAHRARDVMSRNVITASPNEMIMEAVAKLANGRVRHLPVVDADNKLVGFLSDRDLELPFGLSLVAEDDREAMPRRVGELIRGRPITLSPETLLGDLVRLFAQRRLEAAPVVDDSDRLLGIVSYVDLLDAIHPERPARVARA